MPPQQRWDPERYARNARFVADLGEPLIDMLDPRPGERILDVGCGDGALTVKIAAAGAEVLGIDSSEEQIVAARRRGLEAGVMDGEDLPFDAEFDAVFSNAALHWMRRPGRAIASMRRALKPGGRLVAEMGGKGNVARICDALTAALARRGIDAMAANPWYFPDAGEYRRRLEEGGFAVGTIELIARPTPLPGDLADWLETFGESFILAVAEPDRASYIAEVVDALRPELHTESGGWVADYVRLRFTATAN